MASFISLFQFGVRHYGFFGIEGMFGVIIGLICLIVVCVIAWKIMILILPKLVDDATWQQVIRLLVVLAIFLAFLHFFGLY